MAGEGKEISKQTKNATIKIGYRVEGRKNAAGDVVNALSIFQEMFGRMNGILASLTRLLAIKKILDNAEEFF